ncbi:DNA-directed RNA polymerases I and III subunit RPAC1, partial [Durusdinium trenchii]
VWADPHFSMALELGAVYTELELRCGGTPARQRQLACSRQRSWRTSSSSSWSLSIQLSMGLVLGRLSGEEAQAHRFTAAVGAPTTSPSWAGYGRRSGEAPTHRGAPGQATAGEEEVLAECLRQKTFSFASISLDINHRAARHRDQNNSGPSAIAAVGPFQGGELLYLAP